jgi:hypothetical protein
MASPETFQPPPDGDGIMNALRFHGKSDLRYEEIPIPQVRAGQVKVKPAWVGICGTGMFEPITITYKLYINVYNKSTLLTPSSQISTNTSAAQTSAQQPRTP